MQNQKIYDENYPFAAPTEQQTEEILPLDAQTEPPSEESPPADTGMAAGQENNLPLDSSAEQSSDEVPGPNDQLDGSVPSEADTIRANGQKAVAKSNPDHESPEPEEKHLPRYYIDNFWLRYRSKDKDGNHISIALCHMFNVLALIKNLVTGAYEVLIEYWPFGKFDERPITTRIPSGDLEQNKLRANHLSKGEPFFRRDTITHVISYIREEARRLETTYEVPVLGWIRRDGNPDGERAFVCKDFAITKNGVDKMLRYSGKKLTVLTKGTAKEAIEGLNKNFLPYSVAFQMAASMGLTAPLIELLAINEVESILANLFGDSSTGKSTMESLSVSMFAHPEESPEGLNQKCFQTINSLTDTMSGNHGFPFGVDEIGIEEYPQDGSFGYKLSSGIEKGRKGDKPDLSGYGIKMWSTLIVCNGELSLLNKNLKPGARLRIIELNEQWTRDEAEAQTLMAFLKEQHGTIGLRYVFELLKYGEDAIRAEYDKILAEMKPLTPQDRLSQRLTGTLAIIVTAASLANKLIGLETDYIKVMHFLLGAATFECVQTPMAEQVAEFIKNRLAEMDKDAFTPRVFRNNRAGRMESPVMRRNGTIGKVTWRNPDVPVSLILTKKAYEDIVSEQFDAAVATRALKDSGYIICGSNGKTKNGVDKTASFKKCWLHDTVQGIQQLTIEFRADKLGIRGNDFGRFGTVEVVTETMDDGVVDGTRRETYRITPEIIDADGRNSKFDPTRSPDPEPPDPYELMYGKPIEIKTLNENGEPVETEEYEPVAIVYEGYHAPTFDEV